MATAPSRKHPAVSPARKDHVVAMRGVGWEGYQALLKMRGDQGRPKIVYLDGDALLMSPGYLHERWAERMGLFVHEVANGLRIRHLGIGHTTLWLEYRKVGVEPDKAFYFHNLPRVLGKTDLTMGQEPPPDLAIEAVNTRAAHAAIECYRRLEVPEIWIGRAAGLRIFLRDEQGRYREGAASLAMPLVTAADVSQWILKPMAMDDLDWTWGLRDWVRDVLAPRAGIAPNEP